MIGQFDSIFVLVQIAAFWASWLWIWRQAQWGAEGFGPMAALLAAVVLLILFRPRRTPRRCEGYFALAALGTFGYAMCYQALPNTLLALIAVLSMGCAIRSFRDRDSFPPALFTLFVLSVPFIDEVQFYLGYPLRVISASMAAPLVWLAGFPVSLAGAAFRHAGHLVAVDAPCSGISMLWSAWLLASLLSVWGNLSLTRHLVVLTFSTVLLLAANAGRIASLTVLELSGMGAPGFFHEGVGLVCVSSAFAALLCWRRVWS